MCVCVMPHPLPVQASVGAWLTFLGLIQYEQVLIDAGYDDIDFISDISNEELQEIGITKRGEWGLLGHVITSCVDRFVHFLGKFIFQEGEA